MKWLPTCSLAATLSFKRCCGGSSSTCESCVWAGESGYETAVVELTAKPQSGSSSPLQPRPLWIQL
jgi:hypothetical protein